jgi:hypothetical protein
VLRKVLAATYLPDTRSLWIVDQTGQHPKRARLLRYDFATGAFVRLGRWLRTPVFDRVELSGSYEGNLLLSGSSELTHHVAGVVLQPSATKVKVIGAFLRKGVLAVEPTLGQTALTLPLVSDGPTGSDNVLIPNSQIFFEPEGRYDHDRGHLSWLRELSAGMEALASRCAPIVVMKPVQNGAPGDRPVSCAGGRRTDRDQLSDALMRPRPIEVHKAILAQHTMQVLLTEHHDVVQAFPTHAPRTPLAERVHGRGLHRGA